MSSLYSEKNYRSVIKSRLKQAKQEKQLRLIDLASLLGIQYTYLSKCLNQVEYHLSNEHVYQIVKHLGLNDEDVEYVLLLKEFEQSIDESFKSFLSEKITRIRSQKLFENEKRVVSSPAANKNLEIVLEPMALVVGIALRIPKYAYQPSRLCEDLRISNEFLKSTLELLEKAGFIELSTSGEKVLSVKTVNLHLPRGEVITSAHQALIKNQANAQLGLISKKNKYNFTATFSADSETFEYVKSQFMSFVKSVEDKAKKPQTQQNVYHLGFDFFKWT